MSQKFVPDGDQAFLSMARVFVAEIGRDPGRYFVDATQAQELREAVASFGRAYDAAWGPNKSPKTTAAKRAARKPAEAVVRRIANQVRTDERIDAGQKQLLGIKVRSGRPQTRACPAEPPRLKFVRAMHEGTGSPPRHELSFEAWDGQSKRPTGATRLELFVELLPVDAKVPASPVEAAVGNGFGGRLWYWRSYTKSPIELVPPLPDRPMRVVYWARWAGSAGDVGPFSGPAAGWVEGGSAAHLPGGLGMGGPFEEKAKLIEQLRGEHTAEAMPAAAAQIAQAEGGCVVTVMQLQPRMIEAQPIEQADEAT